MHNSHQRHVHQGAQFNKIMREASKEQVEQFASIAIIHDGNHQLGNKTHVKAAHFGWEKETPHAKALNPQVIFIFLPLLDSGLCADVGGKCLKIQNLSWHMTAPHGNTPWPFFHTLEKSTSSYCRIPSQSTSRPILTSYLWCGTDASVDITFKMFKVIQVTGWNLKHAEEVESGKNQMFQVLSFNVQVNIKLTQCTYKLLKHELCCQNRRCKIVDKGFPRTVSNGSLIPMYTWPKNGLKRFPKARTIWNYLKLFETVWNCLKLFRAWLTLPTTNHQNGSKRFLGPHVPESFLNHANYLTYSLQLSP